jgi:hypothetical protein
MVFSCVLVDLLLLLLHVSHSISMFIVSLKCIPVQFFRVEFARCQIVSITLITLRIIEVIMNKYGLNQKHQ